MKRIQLFTFLATIGICISGQSQVPEENAPGGNSTPPAHEPGRGGEIPPTAPGVQAPVSVPMQSVPRGTEVISDKAPASAIRVNVTNQSFNFFVPWEKRQAYSRRALGAVLGGKLEKQVLVTAELVANATYIELEKAESGEKAVAEIASVDYEANLALLHCVDPAYLSGFKALEVHDADTGARANIWQLENTGALLSTNALLTTVEVGRYPIDDSGLLVYRFSAPLQYRDSSFTVPVVKDGKLIGILMRYDARTQTADAIPAPVIQHFLKDAADGQYGGFPRAGIGFAPTRDPQFRRYLGLTAKTPGGVYVTDVAKKSPGSEAGLKKGDVVLAIADRPIDQDGNYADKVYGKIALTHLISTLHSDGETAKFKVFRSGEVTTVDVKLRHRGVGEDVIEGYTLDRAPRFYVLGGLVLTELSEQYLKEWGPEWTKKAPQKFVYMDQFQSELFGDDIERVVILSQVLPTEATLGYERLASLRVTAINGVKLRSLLDVPKALEKPVDGYHLIEFDDYPGRIYLEASQIPTANRELAEKYGLSALKNLD